jgi:DNA polymerase-1
MNTAAMFREELEERGIFIDMEDPVSINRIKDEAPDLRNGSKRYTFGLQYGCGPSKIQSMLKGSRDRADGIYTAFHSLYSGLAEFASRNELEAKKNGYVELAFGLKLKTPRIHSKDMGVQSAEGRSSSNAKTQSYGMLMNRAFIELLQRLKKSKYRIGIKVINCVHDATYFLVREDPETIEWLNINLVECMAWRDDVVLRDAPIPLTAELDIGRDWAHVITLPNNVSTEHIKDAISQL